MPYRSTLMMLALFLTVGLCASYAHADGAFRTVLVIDASSSMKRTDPGDLRKVAAELFVDLARTGDRIAVTGFDENARQSTNGFIGITGPERRERLKQAIRAVGNDGKWTDFTAGLNEAKRMLEASPERPGEQSMIVFLTDGRCEPDPAGPLAAKAATRPLRTELCKELTLNEIAGSLGGARVYAIGLSKDAPTAFLEELGRRTGGSGEVTLDPKSLPSIFAGVYARLLGSRLQEEDVAQRATFEVYQGAKTVDVVLVGRTEKSGTLRDPTGSDIAIDNREPERVYFAAAKEYRFYKIQAPKIGTWTVELPGKPGKPGKPSQASHRLATLQHFDLELSLVEAPRAMELGHKVRLRGRLASRDKVGDAGAMPPMDFLDRHAMYALIGESAGVNKLEMTRADDGTFMVEYTPRDLGQLPVGLSLEPKSGGVLSRVQPNLATLEVIPPVYVRAAALRTEPIKHRESGIVTLDLTGSEVGVPLELSLVMGVAGVADTAGAAEPDEPAETDEPDKIAFELSPSRITLKPGEPTTFLLTVHVIDRAPGGDNELALTITPISPEGFAERAITVPMVVNVVPLSFWERYGTWVVRSAIAVFLLIVLLGFVTPARFNKRAMLYYADIRDPELLRRSSYPLGTRAKRGFYRTAQIELGPGGPVQKNGAVTLRARSGGGIDVLPGAKSAPVFRVDLPEVDENGDSDDSALISDLDDDERPRVPVGKDGSFRMSANLGHEVAGSGFVFWYK